MAYEFLAELDNIIARRLAYGEEAQSYTAKLAAAGITRVAQKVGEEGVELALAGATDTDSKELLGEAADLLFHTAVLLQLRGHSLADVCVVLSDRHAEATDTK